MKLFQYVALLFVFFCCLHQAEAAPQDQGNSASVFATLNDDSSEFTKLTKKAHKKGNVRVLVELNERLTPKDYALFKKKKAKARKILEYQQNALLDDVSVRDKVTITHYEDFPYMAMSVTEAELQQLHNSSRINGIYEDHVNFPMSTEVSNAQVGANLGWNLGYTGKGQSIVVIDTGVMSTIPLLKNKVIKEACISSRIEDKATGIQVVTPRCRGGRTSEHGKGAANPGCRVGQVDCAHGTLVAAVAAGNSGTPDRIGSGVAPDAKIIAVKLDSLFHQSESCAPTVAPCIGFFDSDVLKGLEYVLSLNRKKFQIAAVNLSLGRDSSPAICFKGPMRRAIQKLSQARIATVVASGNEFQALNISFPACIPEAISVGATTADNQIADFSNSGRTLDLLAPGVGIGIPIFGINPNPGAEVVVSGTSFSAPMVAGAWATLKSHKPGASVRDILKILKKSGTRIVDLRNAIIKPQIRIDQAHGFIKPKP